MTERSALSEGGDPWEALKNLDRRLQLVEKALQLEKTEEALPAQELSSYEGESGVPTVPDQEQNSLEFEVGQTWFALIGIIALAIGMAFILSLPFASLPAWLPALGGYLICVVVFVLARLSRSSFEVISKYLRGSGMLLLFFSTVRLSYFGEPPVFEPGGIGSILSFIPTVLVCMGLAWRRQSQILWIISVITACGSAIAVDDPVFLAAMLVFTTAASAYLQLKYNWRSLAPTVFGLTVLTYLLWAIGNPLAGNPLKVTTSAYPVIYVIPISMVLFSAAVLKRPDTKQEDAQVQVSVLLVSGFGFLIFFLHHLLGYDSNLIAGQLFMTLLLLATAFVFWHQTRGYFSTFVFAMTGYLALSMALLKAFAFPEVFVALSVQSLIVIATAIYFCSKFIIVANFLIYIGIILGYLALSGVEHGMSIGFGIVALVSARILNWQKKRLTLETEFMRNAYLTTAFLILPYALFYLAPEKLVSVSWLGLSIFYYLLFLVFGNRKYRWMGHMTLLLTALYVVFIGTAQLDTVYRIIAFLALGTIMIIVSLVFSLVRKKKDS